MDALTPAAGAAADDMRYVQAADRGTVMTNVRVIEKHGGKSGDWAADALSE